MIAVPAITMRPWGALKLMPLNGPGATLPMSCSLPPVMTSEAAPASVQSMHGPSTAPKSTPVRLRKLPPTPLKS